MYNQIIMEAKPHLQTGLSIKEISYELNFDAPSDIQNST